MPTFITVIPGGSNEDPYIAIQACDFKEPLMASKFFRSNNNQPFPRNASDESLGKLLMTNVVNGNKITCEVMKLEATHAINNAIKAPGCVHMAAFGFTEEVQNFITEFNELNAEKVKVKKQKDRLKEKK